MTDLHQYFLVKGPRIPDFGTMIIYSSPLVELSKDPVSPLFSLSWKPGSRNASEPDVRKEFELLLGFVTEYGVQLIFSNSIHYPFHDNMEMQNWMDFEYFPKLGLAGVKAFAVLAGSAAVEEFNAEQGGMFSVPELQYFQTNDEAFRWLNASR